MTQFVQATKAFPDYYAAYYHMGVADLRLGHEEEAAQAFQKAIDLSRGQYAWAQFALGLMLCRRGEYAEAETVIRQGLDLDGSPAHGHLVLSVALSRLNRPEDAEKSAREALLRKPGFARAYLVLADVHGRRGDRKSTRLNSSHRCISYAVICLKKKKCIKLTSISNRLIPRCRCRSFLFLNITKLYTRSIIWTTYLNLIIPNKRLLINVSTVK